MADPARVPVLIVGAGPTGLVLALWLTRAGVPVRIVDKNATPAMESRALAIAARTLEYYDQLGIAARVIAAGTAFRGANVWNPQGRAAHLSFDDIGGGISRYPFALVYPQDQHERLLVDELERAGTHVERPVEFIGLAQRSGGVDVTLRNADGTLEHVDAAYVAACDGAHSPIRAALGIGFDGGTYERLFYVADIAGSGGAINGEVNVGFGYDDFIAAFPMKEAGRVRLVGTVAPASTRGDEPTWDDVDQTTLDLLDLHVDRVAWFATYRVHHRVATEFRDRRVFLLGDAAHVHSPLGGQGMNTGIADAVDLGWRLAEVIHERAHERVLASYETERIAFARRLVATTDRAFAVIASPADGARTVRALLPRLVAFASRFRPIRRQLFRAISQTAVNYRMSAISTGEYLSVHGGDRLPWVAPGDLDGPGDNYAPLAERRWHLQALAPVAPDVRAFCDGHGVPVHEFRLRPGARTPLSPAAIYLVRPDGYLGLVAERNAVDRLEEYWRPLR
jgi:2-polyprenyl-6-methoxyphenol hydroxylase-like FAD-dependent oxidoreductase